MNKAEFVEELATHFGGNKAAAGRALDAITGTVIEQVASGDKVSIAGFGVFEQVHRDARVVRNPKTGERKAVDAMTVPRFRPGSQLKEAVTSHDHDTSNGKVAS